MARTLTAAMQAMVIASEPDDLTGEEGCGVPLRGSAYRTAKALEAMGVGHYQEAGSLYAGMYWSNSKGLSLRTELLARPRRGPRR